MNRIEHQTLNDRAYSEIRKGLITSRFRPGQVLVIRTLAETYGISTTPVREALQRLVAEHLLILKSNRSIAVPELSAEHFQELVRIRCALEGMAAELAMSEINSTHIAKLKVLLSQLEGTVRDRDSRNYVKLNQKFHFTIYECAHSPRLLQMVQDQWGQVGPYLNDLFEDESFIAHANDQHSNIVDALERGRADEVRLAIVKDITVAGEALAPKLAS